MTNGSPLAGSYVPREEGQDQLRTRLDEGISLFHIAGQPGVGKSFLLDWVEHEFGGSYAVERVRIGSHHSIQTLAQKIYQTVLNDIPESVREGERELTGASGSLAGVGLGGSWNRDPPDWAESPFQYIEALEQMSDHLPDGHKRLICLDDIHKLNDDDQKISDALIEIADALGSEITLLSAGRLHFGSDIPIISLSTFSEAQTIQLLTNEVTSLTTPTARDFHDRLGGHPYSLGLLVEIEDPAAAIDVPEADIHHYIEVEYLDALSEREERFLQETSVLAELDEQVCTAVLAMYEEFDQVRVRRLLRSLNKRVIVQSVGTDPKGTTRYAIHDKFREFLHQHLPDQSHAHKAAFEYYANQLPSQISASETDFEHVTHATTQCTHHLSALAQSQTGIDEVADFLDVVFDEDGLPFYSATIILDELKKWKLEELPDEVVEAVLSSLEGREPLERYFLDESIDVSWGEELYLRGSFDEFRGSKYQYLDSIVNQSPELVVKIIQTIDSDDANTRRALISIAGDLPGDAATKTADVIESWVSESKSFRQLDFYAVQLVEHLVEQGESEAALNVLKGVLKPPNRDSDIDWQQDIQFGRYELHELFQSTRESLVSDCGREFIDVLDAALRETLATDTAKEGDHGYDSVARRTPISDLGYSKDNTGERKHILFTYLCDAAQQWVAADPPAADRETYITNYLEEDIPAFRRIGLHLLNGHPEIYPDLVIDELANEENYDDETIQYDFYRLVENAFPTIDDDQQDDIYNILRHGPKDKQWIKDQAVHLAKNRAGSEDEIQQEMVEGWRLKRLYLLNGVVSDDKQSYIDDLVEKHGVPERTVSQPYSPSVSGGYIGQEGPADLDTLRDQSAETVLKKCVEWEPPSDQSWILDDNEKRVEQSHWGFAKQLQQLVQEQPAAYSEAIHLLKDAKPQYADVVLDAFVDALQGGGQFQWPPILNFCETVVNEPDQWSSRCRFSIGRVIGQGIQSSHIDFPKGYIGRFEELLISLLNDPNIASAEAQPSSWIGGVGTTEEEVRQNGLKVLVGYIIWRDQNGHGDSNPLSDPLRHALKERITEDMASPVRNGLGRHFQTFWVANEDMIRTHLDDLFPCSEGEEAKQLFAAAWNGYARSNPLITKAYPHLRQFYIHALKLLAEDESDEGLIDPEATAHHIGLSYIFEDESLDDEDSSITKFYELVLPETAEKVAMGLSNLLENEDSKLHAHWDAIHELWQWRLNQVKSEISGFEDASSYHHEFRYFLQCLQNTDATGISRERELVESTAPYLVQQPHSIRRIEDWLAEQSTSNPTEAISIYGAVVESIPESKWLGFVGSSNEEQRETLYTHAIQANDDAGKVAFKIANRFAAAGCDLDKGVLDRYLGEGDH